MIIYNIWLHKVYVLLHAYFVDNYQIISLVQKTNLEAKILGTNFGDRLA